MLYAMLFGYIVFHEPVSLFSLAGSLLIGVGMVAAALGKSSDSSKASGARLVLCCNAFCLLRQLHLLDGACNKLLPWPGLPECSWQAEITAHHRALPSQVSAAVMMSCNMDKCCSAGASAKADATGLPGTPSPEPPFTPLAAQDEELGLLAPQWQPQKQQQRQQLGAVELQPQPPEGVIELDLEESESDAAPLLQQRQP